MPSLCGVLQNPAMRPLLHAIFFVYEASAALFFARAIHRLLAHIPAAFHFETVMTRQLA